MHRNIISAHSGYFRQLCRSQFLESCDREIHLHDDDPRAVEVMIDYFYSCRYTGQKLSSDSQPPSTCRTAPHSSPDALAHAQVFLLADKYDIPGLASLAHQAFHTDIHAEALSFFSVPLACGVCTTGAAVEAVKHVYEYELPHDQRLRHSVLSAFMLHMLLAKGIHSRRNASAAERLSRVGFDKLLACSPPFAADLHRHFSALSIDERLFIVVRDTRSAFVRGDDVFRETVFGSPYHGFQRWQQAIEHSTTRVSRLSKLKSHADAAAAEATSEDMMLNEALGQDDPPRDLYLASDVDE